MIEVCIVTCQRYYRLPAILSQLAFQTRQDFNLNIWNNTEKELELGFLPKERIKVFGDQKNHGSQARFWLVPLTKGNPIIFLDDDETIEKDFIDYYYKQYLIFGEEYILGWYGKVWQAQETNFKYSNHTKYGQEADYLGTGGMVLGRKIFDKFIGLQKIPKEFRRVEDLYLSVMAKMQFKMKLMTIESKCVVEADWFGQGQFLATYKQRAFEKLRQQGWRFIKEF